MNYKDCVCIVCNKKFSDDDDIVVCPECATPYHRECYKKNNRCINTVLHEKKESWKPDNTAANPDKPQEEKPEEPVSETRIICAKCGAVNKSSSKFCENCGETLINNNTNQNTSDEKDRELSEKLQFLYDSEFTDIKSEQLDGIEIKEIARFIDKNIFYYLNVFSRLKKRGRSISFNLLCFFVPYYYFANRKMYLWAFISFMIMTVLSIPEMMMLLADQLLYIDTSFLESGIFNAFFNTCSFLILFFRIGIALTANAIYYRHIKKSINTIKKSVPESEWSDTIARKGGTCFPAVLITVLIELVTAVILMLILSFIMLFF